MAGERFYLVSEDGASTELNHGMQVGRSSQCGLSIDDAQVSRTHACFHITDSGLAVEDLDSSNGTSVDGSRITELHELKDGDEVCFGRVPYQVRVECDDKTVISVVAADRDRTQIVVPSASEEAVRPAGIPGSEDAEPDEELGEETPGAIEVMPLQQHLPPAWAAQGASNTQFISTSEIGAAAEQESFVVEGPELDRLEATTSAPTLLITSGKDAGRPYKLQSVGELSFWTIGKGSGSQTLSIIVSDPSVSDYHAKLVHKRGRWKIVDQMSTNHTYVNGEKYNSAFLSSRDVLQFGAVKALFLLPSETAMKNASSGARKSLLQRLLRFLRIRRS